jgi:hypothetical protein
MAVAMNNAVFSDVITCGSCNNRGFGRNITSIIRVRRIGEVETLAVTTNRSTHRDSTLRTIPEDGILLVESRLQFSGS